MELAVKGSEKELVKFLKMNKTYASRKGLTIDMVEEKKAEPKKEAKEVKEPKERKPRTKKAEPKKEAK